MDKSTFLALRIGDLVFNKGTGQVLELTSDFSFGCEDPDGAWITSTEISEESAMHIIMVADCDAWDFMDVEIIIEAFSEVSPLFRAIFTVLLHRLKIVESVSAAMLGVASPTSDKEV